MTSSNAKRSLLHHALPFFRGRVPGQLIIQLTDHCNASCPQCGMRRNAPFRRTLLSLDDVRRIIDHAARSGITSLSFTGGEPFLFPDELITSFGTGPILPSGSETCAISRRAISSMGDGHPITGNSPALSQAARRPSEA